MISSHQVISLQQDQQPENVQQVSGDSMLSLKDLRLIICLGNLMASLDLQEAYLHVPHSSEREALPMASPSIWNFLYHGCLCE